LVNSPKPKVAIFGGSFDPPHRGHQQIVQTALENLDIDLLLLVPTYLNPFKSSSLASSQQRLNWCHTLFDPLAKVCVKDYEVIQGKSTVTSQSVKYFNQSYAVSYLIIGADNLASLKKWHEYEWLNQTITWVIATRDNYDLETEGLRAWKILPLNAPISSTQIRRNKDLKSIDFKIQDSVKQTLEGKDR
jgi:nicotinate-nucleotide adenylyltransferase